MKTEFRSATNHDIDTLVHMMREFNALDNSPFDEKATRAALEKFIGDASLGALYIIEGEGESIGYAALTFSFSFEFRGRDAFLDELFIDARHRGKGVGARVMEFLEERCREFNVSALHLEVNRDNAAAQALYRKFGFRDHDRYLMTKWISS